MNLTALFQQYKAILAAVLVLVLMAGTGVGVWIWQANKYERELAEKQSQTDSLIAEINEAAAQSIKSALDKQQSAQKAIADLDQKYSKEKADALEENRRLRAAVADGTKRLQLKASCPAANDVPDTASASSLGNGGGPRLDDAAQRDYWILRDRIVAAGTQIKALQDYVRNVCLAGK
ncbi:lysis protein [Pseudomonas luteola]|uniref:lysis protein n=1 Tax=Pseudomonas luteola TaxID=47886 RepID=UPI003A870B7E